MLNNYADYIIRKILIKQGVKKGSCLYPTLTSLFQGLSENSLQVLLAHSLIRHFTADQMIVQQGEHAEYLCCIINGTVKTVRYSPEGEETTIRMLSAFDTFIDAAIFMSGASPISVKAMTDSTIMMISADAVRRHALNDLSFANNLLKIVSRHYGCAIQQIDSIVTKSPTSRVGYYLLQLYLKRKEKSLNIDLPCQKATIANHLGMAPETFSRSLNQIKSLGVRVSKSQLVLQDPYVLCEFCDGDTARLCPNFNMEKCAHCIMDKKSH